MFPDINGLHRAVDQNTEVQKQLLAMLARVEKSLKELNKTLNTPVERTFGTPLK